MPRPLALTLGGPAGIGPDITLAAWSRRAELALPAFYVVGDPGFLERLARRLAPAGAIAPGQPETAAATFISALPVVPLERPISTEPGRPDSSSAPAAIASITRAVADTVAGRAAAVVTNPVAKAVLYRNGFIDPGHTEFLARLAQEATREDARAVMMLWSPELAVIPVTIHLPLREVPARLTSDLVVDARRASSPRCAPPRPRAGAVLDFAPRVAGARAKAPTRGRKTR